MSGVASSNRQSTFSKSDFRYWEKKVFKHSRSEGGTRVDAKNYSVKMAFRKKRHNLALGVPTLRDAAKIAAGIYKTLITEGWDPVLSKYRVSAEEPEEPSPVTIGQWIESARTISRVKPRTFEDYCRSLRQITAGISGLRGNKTRFDQKSGGAAKWRETVEATPLQILTKPAVEAWMISHTSNAAGDPKETAHRQNGCNSILRMASSLFTTDLIDRLSATFELPKPLPFAGVKPFKTGSKLTRYRSKIDAKKILRDAESELGGDPEKVEEWKALLLALCCGLRKSEIDCLTWSQINTEEKRISI